MPRALAAVTAAVIAALALGPASAAGRRDCIGFSSADRYAGPCQSGGGAGSSWGFPYLALSHGYGPVLLDQMRQRGVDGPTRDRVVSGLVDLVNAGRQRGKAKIYDWARQARIDRIKALTVTCALFGAAAAGVDIILQAISNGGHVDLVKALKAGATGCALAVASPYIKRFLSRRGYNLEA